MLYLFLLTFFVIGIIYCSIFLCFVSFLVFINYFAYFYVKDINNLVIYDYAKKQLKLSNNLGLKNTKEYKDVELLIKEIEKELK